MILARVLARSIERYAPKDALLHILHSGSAKQANHKSSKGLMALSLEVYGLDSVTIKFLYKHSFCHEELLVEALTKGFGDYDGGVKASTCAV